MNHKTDRTVLLKGVKIMMGALFCTFLGPILMSIAFNNQEKPLYIPILIVSFLFCGAAIYLIFRGINTIMNSMFQKK